jgi:hypothetical protein
VSTIPPVCASFVYNGSPILSWAIVSKKNDIASRLIELRADVNSPTARDGRTPLHYAIMGGNTDIVHPLIRAGANVKAKTRNKSTPMMYAFRYNKPDIIAILRDIAIINKDIGLLDEYFDLRLSATSEFLKTIPAPRTMRGVSSSNVPPSKVTPSNATPSTLSVMPGVSVGGSKKRRSTRRRKHRTSRKTKRA